ncbi:divIVA domain protein [Mycobacterium xenopi 3993]|nr:divIVA domain protein [Mycobacterium xenopi 3993]
MPLTPADVHNVAFSKPPIGKRGYNEDEVDAFLDLVEAELTRLIEENSDLRQRVSELEQELATARAGGGAQPTEAMPLYRPEPEPEPAPAAPVDIGEDQAIKAARVLSLAQDTADRLTRTAKVEAEKLLADARANADQIVAEPGGKPTPRLPRLASARTRCWPMRKPAPRPSCARPRRRLTRCRPTPNASIPKSWAPSTSSAACWRAAWSSFGRLNASTAPG